MCLCVRVCDKFDCSSIIFVSGLYTQRFEFLKKSRYNDCLKLHETLGERDRLRQQLTDDQSRRNESEEKVRTEKDTLN